MRIQEGRGYYLRTGVDGPWAGWMGVSHLDSQCPVIESPWLAASLVASALGSLPGGLGLVWDLPPGSFTGMRPDEAKGLFRLLGSLPGLSLHIPGMEGDSDRWAGLLEVPLNVWIHGTQPPVGELGAAWRQGRVGWMPQPVPAACSLPGLGRADLEESGCRPGWLWGEVVLPLGALGELDPGPLLRGMAEAQAGLELAMSQRLTQGTWPALLPFHRRRTGWRVAFLGGREALAGGAGWERAAGRARELVGTLETGLRCPIHAGVCEDPELALSLGQLALRQGLECRASLPLPPSIPSFTPGLGADPRVPSSCEGRAQFPPEFAWLSVPPVARMRVPVPVQEEGAEAFIRRLGTVPALSWLPPGVAPPGPALSGRPWAPCEAFPALADPAQAQQPGLFPDPD